MGDSVLVLALVVIVIGGVGSVRGALVAGPGGAGGYVRPVLSALPRWPIWGSTRSWRWYCSRGLVACSPPVAEREPPPPRPALRLTASPRRLLVFVALFRLLAAVPFLAQAYGAALLCAAVHPHHDPRPGAVSLDLLLGFGGLVSLGHAAFVGVGA